jgi:hypothetical protein
LIFGVSYNVSLTCLRVEEVNYGHKYGVEHGPDNPEFPAKALDANGGDLNNDEVGDPVIV